MGLGDILGTIVGVAGAPFTGGASLALPAILGGASALGAGLSNTQGARTQTMTPTMLPQYQTLADLLRTRAEDRLRQSADLSGYSAAGLQGINQAFGNVGQSLSNALTARGLSTSPIAGAATTQLQAARGGNIANFMNSLPLLQRQMQSEDMMNALNVLGLGRGTTTVLPGSAAGSAITAGGQSFASLLGLLNGGGFLGTGGSTGGSSGWPGGWSGLGL